MLTVLASLLLASVLGLAAGMKAADRQASVVALDTYGLRGRAARAAWAGVLVAEVLVAAGLLVGASAAAWAAAALLSLFAVAQAVVLARRGPGAPCGCFGRRGRVSAGSIARTGAGAALATAAAVGPAWEGLSLPLALSGVAAASVAGAYAARRGRPDGALDIAGEGPSAGERLGEPAERPRLLVFGSRTCGLCASLEPQIAPVAERAGAEVVHLDESDDAGEWARYRVPGSPYAVVLDRDGIVVSKGTVNDARQVASLLEAPGARAAGASRRTFLRRAAGAAAAASAAPTVASLVRPGEADAYHFCGHIYTTDSCPHPTGLPRIDSRGFPLRARDGHPVDDLGRPVDRSGRPVGEDGLALTDPDGRALPPASRTRVCSATGREYGIPVRVDGAWYRCCGGTVRKLVDCCSTHPRRINGDRSLRGYCYRKRKVFCVMYFQTRVPC